MDLLLDTADALERRQQGCWLQELHTESKKLHALTQEVQGHYTATLSTLKSITHAYENINGLLVSVSRYFSEVSIGSRIGVSTNVGKFKGLVTTIGESPQGKEMQRLLKDQIHDAEALKAQVKHSFAALKERDHQYAALASARPSVTQRARQVEAEAKLAREVREIYAGASRVVDKECIGFVRAWTGVASAVIQLVQDRYTRSLLAATDAVGTSNGYTVTGVVQLPAVAAIAPPPPLTNRAASTARQSSGYGLNDNDYVSQPDSDVPEAMLAPAPTRPRVYQRADAGVALQFVE